MRNNIVSSGAEELKYEIREIVAVAKEFGKLGVEIMWGNAIAVVGLFFATVALVSFGHGR